MWFKQISIFLFVLISLSEFASAQQDSVKTDSIHLYKNIESYSKRSRFTRLIYRLIFKPVTPDSQSKTDKNKGYKKLIQKPYSTFEGKIIRNIEVVTLDPFGFSANDTTVAGGNILSKAGNWMHIKTQGITVRNLLLMHKNQPFNTLLVKESERLIRSQRYVHEVSFSVVAAGNKSDSVDIFIREADKWSIIPDGAISTTGFRVDLTEKNFLGYGHEFQNAFSRNYIRDTNSFNTNYYIPNIRNTYIRAKLHFGVDGYI